MTTRSPTESVIARLPLRALDADPAAGHCPLDTASQNARRAGTRARFSPPPGNPRLTFRAPTVAATPAARRFAAGTRPRGRLATGTEPPPVDAAPRLPVAVPKALPKPPPTLWVALGSVAVVLVLLLALAV